jgi:hypothetical protein
VIGKFLVPNGTRKFIAMFTGVISPPINLPDHEAGHLPLFRAEVNNALGFIPTLCDLLMRRCLVTGKILHKPRNMKKIKGKAEFVEGEKHYIFMSAES